MSEKRIRAFVDRIEDDLATVLLGEDGDQAILPAHCLPEGAGEGSVLRVIIDLDERATKRTENVIDKLIDRLERGQ